MAFTKQPFALLAAALVAWHAPDLAAQSACSSDGAPAPAVLFERFLSADCDACWTTPSTPAPTGRTDAVVLDWIVPTPAGDEAALSAVATRDALARLEALGRPSPRTTDVHIATVESTTPARVRVARGMAFNDYLGTSIAWSTPAPRQPQRGVAQDTLDFYLLLVEAIPAGADGTPVGRNLVRNVLQGTWKNHDQLSKKEHLNWMEQRPMRIPEGARPDRLRVVGWVQDASGRVLAAAQSVCR